jgi:hypothetical protein
MNRFALCLVSAALAFSCGQATTTADAGTSVDAGVPCSSTMFAKYGAAGFTAVNSSIINKAVAAPTASVGTSFQGLSQMQAMQLTNNLAAFLVQAYGGPKNYAGKDMKAAHMGLNITEAQYDYFISNVVVPALSENGVAMDDITNCFAPPVTEKKAGSVKCDTVQSGTKPTGCP